ncbi:MAG: hypothetical protein IKO64_03340 [Kiritimatiellae bacterium]|nr:hypothetical protein [Kiritimatiellia bacterium]
MTNPVLNTTILQILSRVGGLKEKTLQNETSILMDRPNLTTVEFEDALHFLRVRDLVRVETLLLGDKFYSITPRGEAALEGA